MTKLFAFAAVAALAVSCGAQEMMVSPSDVNMTQAAPMQAENSVVVMQGTVMPSTGCGCGTYTMMAAPVRQDCGCGGSVAAPVVYGQPVATTSCGSCNSCATPVASSCNCCQQTRRVVLRRRNNNCCNSCNTGCNTGCCGTYTAAPVASCGCAAPAVSSCGCSAPVAVAPVTQDCGCSTPVSAGCNTCAPAPVCAPASNCCQPTGIRALRSQPVRGRLLSRRNTCC